ncbi:MAG: sigma-70 family RNA polymerase sigma factor [Bacillota bacterium]
MKDEKKVSAWVYRITRNAIVDYYRRKEKTPELTQIPEPTVNVSLDELSVNAEISNCLPEMIGHLPEKYKQAIIFAEFHNLTQKELGEKVGLSLSGAKSRVQRAREKLKEMLLGCCDLEFDRLGNIIDYKHKSNACKFC